MQFGIEDGLISIPSSTSVAAPAAPSSAPAASTDPSLTPDDMLRHEQWLYDVLIVDKDASKYPPRP